MVKDFRSGLLLLAALASSACTVHKTEAPPLTGPSELALSVRVTATPDSLSLDGGSQSAVVVEARDANGAPRSGLPVRLDIVVGQTLQDCGQLSARNVVTSSDGRATSIFTAPAMPLPLPQCQGFSGVVTIIAIPSGNNFDTSQVQSATIRMVPPGVILPPAQTPTPSFTFAPTTPTAGLLTQFNGSASCAGAVVGGVCSSSSSIISYTWDFGDGATATGAVVSHTFRAAQTYSVTLTVTNDRGVSASTTQVVTVGASAAPVAQIDVSPTTIRPGNMVFFSGAKSTAATGRRIVRYEWDFGDGKGETNTGPQADHVYGAVNTYTVILTVTDDLGLQGTTSTTFDVVP